MYEDILYKNVKNYSGSNLWRSTFRSKRSTRWNWPLRVGILESEEALINELRQFHWTNEFCEFTLIKPNDGHYNIVFSAKGIESVFEELKDLSLQTDLLLIRTSDVPERTELSEEEFVCALKCGEQHQPNALFLLSTTLDNVQWFGGFIENLSHNLNSVDAIIPFSDYGMMVYDKNFEEDSSLEQYLLKVVDTIQNISDSIPEKFNVIENGTKISIDKKSFLHKIDHLLKNPIWQHEGGNASETIKQTRSLPENLKMLQNPNRNESDLKSNQGFIFFFAMSPPPDEIAETSAADPEEELLEMVEMEDKTAGASPDEAPSTNPPEPIDSPRFLQTSFHKTESDSVPLEYLLTNQNYHLKINIGYPEKDRDHVAVPIPEDTLFVDPLVQTETIYIHVLDHNNIAQPVQEIQLPRSGNSTFANFLLSIPDQIDYYTGEVAAYHKNRILQRFAFRYPVFKTDSEVDKNRKREVTLINLVRNHFSTLSSDDIVVASLSVNSTEGKESSMVVHSSNAFEQKLLSSSDENLIVEIGKLAQQLVTKPVKENEGLKSEEINKTMVDLARLGSYFYQSHLNSIHIPEGRIQLETRGNFFVPLDLVYDDPAPTEDATLCEHGVEALKAGKCAGCFDKTQLSPDHYCPFGFWGLRREIERTQADLTSDKEGSYGLRISPTSDKRTLSVLNNTLLGYSERVNKVDPAQTLALIKGVKAHVGNLVDVKDWKTWKDEIEQRSPETLIWVVHIEPGLGKIDKIEFGDEDFKSLIDINKKILSTDQSRFPPFIIAIGCEASNASKPGYDVSSRLINSGAAVVISNFTKIIGRQATRLVQEIVNSIDETLKDDSIKDASFSTNLVRLRQKLLSKGIAAGITLVIHGDSQWKIK